MKKFNDNGVYDILVNVITEQGTTWQEITAAVKKEYSIKNWLKVRGVLQFYINENKIERTDDMFSETYIKL